MPGSLPDMCMRTPIYLTVLDSSALQQGGKWKLCEQVEEDFINHSTVCDPENPNYPKTLLSAWPGTGLWC